MTRLLTRLKALAPSSQLAAAAENQARIDDKRWKDLNGRWKDLTNRLGALEGQLKSYQEVVDRRMKDQARLLNQARREPVIRAEDRFFELAAEVSRDQRTLLGMDRLYVLWQAALNSAPLELPAVEIGTFRGGSAFFLAAALRHASGEEHELHVFDSFEGHSSEDTSAHEPHHEPGRFAEADFGDVRDYLSGFAKLQLNPIRFPEGADRLPAGAFGLVHIDVDLHKPTLAALEYFAERTAPGAVIVVDDFGAPKCPGVAVAVDEFLAARPPFAVWEVDTEQLVLVRR